MAGNPTKCAAIAAILILRLVVLSIFTHRGTRIFLFQTCAAQGAAMLARSLPMKSRKRLACDVFDTLATHAGFAHGVTDTDCLAQNVSTHGRVFATFKQRL